ncbi:hypothetical protein ACHAXM_004078 [Skeletonema potamos]
MAAITKSPKSIRHPMSGPSFDDFKEEKECDPSWVGNVDWSSSESDVPSPPSSELSDSPYSTFTEHISSSFPPFSSSPDNNDDAATTCVQVFSALPEMNIYDYDESVEISGSNKFELESSLEVLRLFTLRCSLDHWTCMVAKENEKCKHQQIQQACLQLIEILKRVQVRRSLLIWYQTNQRIAWQVCVLEALRQRNICNAFRSWRDITKSSNNRRKAYFLMMIFNRWRVQTEERIAWKQKNFGALMHWAERLQRKTFSALKLHTVVQREEREHGSYQPQLFRSSLRSPEKSLVWRRNRAPEYIIQSHFGDQERRFAFSKDTATVLSSLRSPLQSISPSFRFEKNRFHEFWPSQTARGCWQPGTMRGSTNQRSNFTIPYAYASDDDIIV